MNELLHNLGPIVCDNSILRNNFSKCNNCLKVAHINIQSINPSIRNSKFEEFKYIVEDSMSDILAVSETWLKSHIPDSSVSIENYYIIRNDRESLSFLYSKGYICKNSISTFRSSKC